MIGKQESEIAVSRKVAKLLEDLDPEARKVAQIKILSGVDPMTAIKGEEK